MQPNRSHPPDMAELHKMLSQALSVRGQRIHASWLSADRSSEILLDVISNHNGGDPKWRLCRNYQGSMQLLFDYPSCDVLLVHNFINSSCADLLRLSKASNFEPSKFLHAPPPIAGHLGQVTNSPSTPDSSQTAQSQATQSQSDSAAGHSQLAQSLAAQARQPRLNSNDEESITPEDVVPRSGEISEVPVAKILQALKSAKLTGKLEIRNNQATSFLYVQEGRLIDATAADTEGDEAIIELLTWKDGHFVFEPRVLRNSQTVHQPIESLVAQSKLLAERMGYLRSVGIKSTSIVLPKHAQMSDIEFVQKVSPGSPLAIAEMVNFYANLRSKPSVEQLMKSSGLPKLLFINVLYHFVINDLMQISNEIVLPKSAQMQPRVIDSSAIQGVMMGLRRLETGMFIYPAFLYFLEQEYFRCYRSKTPLSVIVFEMSLFSTEFGKRPCSTAAILDAVLRISQLKRHVDLLAHYDTSDYALLLPNTKANGAQIFAKRIVKALTEAPLAGEIDANQLHLALGCASMPEDFSDLESLLGGADLAMQRSRLSNKPVVMYREIRPITLGNEPKNVNN